ncbi:MAG: hypothetical protein ACRDP1_06085 [Nocardioidaceae bacterium]
MNGTSAAAGHRMLLAVQGSKVNAGLVGALVIVGLAVATVLLMLSFRRQLRKVKFDESPDEPSPGPGEARDGDGRRADRGAPPPRRGGEPDDTGDPGEPRTP